MMFYTTAINGVFAALIAGGLIFARGGVTKDFLLDLLFYIIITPIISVTLTRIMFQSENAMIVDDALHRIDSVLDLKPLAEPAQPEHPRDASVQLNHVHFSYDGGKRGDPGCFPFYSRRAESGLCGTVRGRKNHSCQSDLPVL